MDDRTGNLMKVGNVLEYGNASSEQQFVRRKRSVTGSLGQAVQPNMHGRMGDGLVRGGDGKVGGTFPELRCIPVAVQVVSADQQPISGLEHGAHSLLQVLASDGR